MRPKVIAYGEDALTFWALTTQLDDFLRQCDDPSSPDQTSVIYRPSFGRGGRAKTSRGAERRSEFGEFDAIVCTGAANYLVESKWSRSSEYQEGIVRLRDEQVHRHRVLRWLIDKWRLDQPPDWGAFSASNGAEFETAFPGMRLAPNGSILASNLEFVLSTISASDVGTRDVLLYLSAPGSPAPEAVRPESFSLVSIGYATIRGSAYFRLV